MSDYGYDLGNRYGKLVTEDTKNDKSEYLMDEIFIAWKKIPKEEYEKINPKEIKETTNKVKYDNEYFIAGDVGNAGITNKNKGHKDVVKYSNMIKLVNIARALQKQGLTEDLDAKIETGTPFEDFNIMEKDYISLMLSKDVETITLDDVEYKIKVTDCEVTKQSAVVIYTLPNRKSTKYAIWDLGGGTLDVSIFENGHRITGKTIDFELNEIYELIGYEIAKYVSVDERPSKLDSRFQKSIEELMTTGKYKDIETVITDEGKEVKLRDVANELMQTKFNEIVDQTAFELGFSQITLDLYNHVFCGGGAISLKKEIEGNKKLKKKQIQEQSQFSNAKAYYKIRKAKSKNDQTKTIESQ